MAIGEKMTIENFDKTLVGDNLIEILYAAEDLDDDDLLEFVREELPEKIRECLSALEIDDTL